MTLDVDVEQIIRTSFRTEVASLGEPRINLDRALQVAADLEDDDLVRKLRAGS